MRVDVDGDEMVLVLVEGNLERVEDKADVGFFQSVKGNEFFFELVAQDLFSCVQWRTHSDLEGTGTNDSSAFKASVLACWLNHEESTAKVPHVADMATLFEPTSFFRPVFHARFRFSIPCESQVGDDGR